MDGAADARTAELERRIAAELVQRGLVAPAALSALHAEGRARGAARGGSFLAGAVAARGLAPLALVDAIVARARAPVTSDPPTGLQPPSERPTVADAQGVPGGSATTPWVEGPRYALPARLVDGPQQALDRRLGRDVTLHAGPRGDPRIQRAALALARLDHPAIPRVHDLGELDARSYYTTDPLSGARLDEAEAPALPALLRAFLDVGAAVAHAHRAGVVHGDLGPARVVLGDAGEAWVTGWGEATGQPADDVRGLGRVLEGALAASGRAPGPLRAVARQALREGGAYARVEDVVEDVRRYLDGEGVVAEPESLPRALARLARRHPGPAGVIGVIALALLAIGALAARGLLAAAAGIEAADREATRAEADAREQLELAERSEAVASASAAAAGTKLRIEDALARAQAAATGERALEAYADARRDAEALAGADRAAARARARTRQARFELDDLRPEAALVTLRDDAPSEPLRGPDVELLRYLAGRRAVGPEADAVALRAHAALAAGPPGDPLAETARALRELPALEAERARLRLSDEVAAVEALEARAAPLIARLRSAVEDRPDLALAHEALGRALVVTRDEEPGFVGLVTASLLDPADPEPRLHLIEAWERKFGQHDRRRWVAGWWLRQLEGATRLTRRPEPLLALARLCVELNDRPHALPAALRLLALERPATGAAAWDEAELFAARARLEASELPGDALLRLAPGPGVDESRLRALRAWTIMRLGRQEEALEEAAAALRTMGAHELDLVPARDVVEAIAFSPRGLSSSAYPPLFEALAASKLPPPLMEAAYELVAMARARGESTHGRRDEYLPQLVANSAPGRFISAEAQLALARVRFATGDPEAALVLALIAWAQVGLDRDDLRLLAHDARAFFGFVLRQRGDAAAAARFEAIDLDEPTARRAWSPR